MLGLSKKPSLGRRRHDHMEERGRSSMHGNPSDHPNVAWERLPWKKLEVAVYRMQKRIFQASKRGDTKTVHKIQKLLMKSEAARLLAVRRVTQDNQGKKTAGVDGVKSVPPAERLKMVEAIHPKQTEHRKPKPLRRVWIPKPGKEEKRPLGIPIWAAHCLSFQAMFGIPCVVLLVDRSSRSTIIVILYHKLTSMTSASLLPLPPDWLAQGGDDLGGERNPAWSQRRGTNTLQDASLTPVRDGRDIDIEQVCCSAPRLAPISPLSRRCRFGRLGESTRIGIGVTNPLTLLTVNEPPM